MIETLPQVFKRLHYPVEIILVCVRWYVACPLSLRHLGETMSERGVMVDHSTIHRWAINMLPVLAAVFRRRKRPVGKRWRMDETFVRVAGQWTYLYRAVDKEGDTIAFLLRARRDHAAARAFFERAIAPARLTREKNDRQKRLQHRCHCEHPGRQRLGASAEVPQQHQVRRASDAPRRYLSNAALLVHIHAEMRGDYGWPPATRPACTRRQLTSAWCSSRKTGLRNSPCKPIRDRLWETYSRGKVTRPMIDFKTFRCARILPDRRHRDNAHDSQRPTLRHQRTNLVAGQSVLLTGLFERVRPCAFVRPHKPIAAEPSSSL
jgi:transposase-like protein